MSIMTVRGVQQANAAQPGGVPVMSAAITTQNATETITLETKVVANSDVHNPILVVGATVSGTTGTGTTKVSDLIRSITIADSNFRGGEALQIDGPALKYAGIIAAALDHAPSEKMQLEEAAVDPVITGDGTYEGRYMLPADLPAGVITVQINMNAFVCAGFTAVTYGARTAYLIAPQRATSDKSLYRLPKGVFKSAISTWSDEEHGVSPETAVIGDGAVNYGILGNGSVVLIGAMTPTQITTNVQYWRKALGYTAGGSQPDYQLVFDETGSYPSLKGVTNFSLAVFTWAYAN